MNTQPVYDLTMAEIHHTKKLDAPSGTAITLANDIISLVNRKKQWVNTVMPAVDVPYTPEQLLISSERVGEVPGTHTITYQSDVDSIEIKHTAHSRTGFALGAIMAAEWIIGKKGIFGMSDMLQF